MEKLAFGRATLRQRLFTAFTVIIVMMAACSASLVIQFARMDSDYYRVQDFDRRALDAKELEAGELALAQAVQAVLLDPGNTQLRAAYDMLAMTFDLDLNGFANSLQATADGLKQGTWKRITDLRAQLAPFEIDVVGRAETDLAAASAIYAGPYTELRSAFSAELAKFDAGTENLLRAEVDNRKHRSVVERILTIAVPPLSALIGFAISRSLAKSIATPVTAFVEVAETIAQGDLTADVGAPRSEDEIGRLTKAFGQMVVRLRSLIQGASQAATEMAATSEELSASSEETVAQIQQIVSATENIARGAQEGSAGASRSVQSVQVLAGAITQVAQGAQAQLESVQTASDSMKRTGEVLASTLDMLGRVNGASKRNTESAAQGSKAVSDVIATMRQIRQATGEVARGMNGLHEHSQEIRKIVDVIDSIAAQTNLLALNAAIEAARAGEYGRGFAVVADEVRKLAERSAQETKAITELVEQISSDITHAVEPISAGAKEVDNGTGIAQAAGEVLRSIYESARETQRLADDLTQSAKGLQDATSSVTRAIDEILVVAQGNSAAAEQMTAAATEVRKHTEGVASMSEENAAASEEVAASTDQVRTSIRQVGDSAQRLAGRAADLRASLSKFKVQQNVAPALAERPLRKRPLRPPPAGHPSGVVQ
jgi:methyl-accepting chemotaxis protein